MRVGKRTFTAVFLLSVILGPSAARASAELHPSLEALEAWLGEWDEGTEASSSELTGVEYRSALGGRFVESWHRHLGTEDRRLRVHSMMASTRTTVC